MTTALINDKIKKSNSALIGNFKNLLHALEISDDDVSKLRAFLPHDRYKEKTIKKKDGSDRKVYAPIPVLKKIQNRIKNRILANQDVISWPSYIFGSIKNQKIEGGGIDSRDYVSCAAKHSGAKSLLTVDIKDFFDNVHEDIVAAVFERYVSTDKEVINWLLDVCCYEQHLVQGAPTSSYLANMSLYDIEPQLVHKLARKGLIYTRLVDDISVSSKIYDYNFSYALKLIEDALSEKGLYLNPEKISQRSVGSAPLTMHGLRIDYQTARLPAAEVGQIRAHVKNLEDAAKSYKSRTSYAYRQDYARCMGRVNKLARVKHNQHSKYLARLRAIQPLPSGNESTYCLKKLEVLEKTYLEAKETFSYRKNFYRLQEKINILSRSFPRSAEDMKKRMKLIAPPPKDGK
ncbi:reverse transcriptase family protein [Alcaligenes sp. A-TC2]|uniref:reverse transcriptase family protein n=1 Tax=Alcaligenes TaxID=507 RepID=UPI000E13908B|nr:MULTISPECIES: reverse transcriptase family protein [Alcaligenes]MCX5471620.1 reverse transcriptase family protein [Alcaligenes nematophilus]SUU82394.1 Retron-type reverse transcriptase [Alcaligenes faecalis subsp. faecalis]